MGLSNGKSNNVAKPYTAPWQTLPPPPPMPKPHFSGTARVNGIDLWYATYGAKLEDSRAQGYSPVVFIHGGFANSDYFSNQINHLQDQPFTLITLDSRAQGRSGDDASKPLTYDSMTNDVVALMDHLEIDRFSTVGWSDGGIISFNLAMNYTNRIDRIFSFGGSYHYQNVNETVLDTQTFKTYLKWVEKDFARNSPSSGTFEEYKQRILDMWEVEPVWTSESFTKIPSLFNEPNAPIIWVVAGDTEEAVTRSTPGEIHSFVSDNGEIT